MRDLLTAAERADHAGIFEHRGLLPEEDVNEDASEHPNLKEEQRQRDNNHKQVGGAGRDHHENGEGQDKEEKKRAVDQHAKDRDARPIF